MSDHPSRLGPEPIQRAFGLDLASYLDELEDLEVSEAQKLEFLYLVAIMMETFVCQGIDVGICGQLLEAFNQSSTATPTALPSMPQLETKGQSDLRDGGLIDE